jgi:transposase
VLNADETGWKTHGQNRWIWVFTTTALAFFHIAASRGSKVLKEVLGDVFHGTLCSDMYSAYKAFHKGARQFCWAHIIRTVKGVKHACRSPDAVKFSKWMLSETGRMFALWHAFKDERLDRKTLVLKSVPIRARMNRCLQHYLTSDDYDVRQTAKSLLKHWESLFTFLEQDGVEPTNNLAERALRPAVQWRKICFGNQSEEGEILTARLLTVTRTCKLQHRNPLAFLVDSIIAHRSGLPTPSLI